MPADSPSSGCSVCAEALVVGPLGPLCLRCALAFVAQGSEADAEVQLLFPELRIEGKLSRGGFATVYRAEHRSMQRLVALKLLDPHHTSTPEAVALFEREMIHAGALDHPAIVRAYDAGHREGSRYLLMELVPGEDYGGLVRRHGVLPLAESCELIRQAAQALHYAHARGLVHRDVKPGNLMLTRGENPGVKVLDFGLAHLAADSLADPLAEAESERFLGTLEYMAPEQMQTPGRVDARADVYGLGATLRRLLTAQPLRAAASEHSLLLRREAMAREPLLPIATLRPDLPRALAALCDDLVALEPAARPATAEEVARRLAPWCAGAELARLFGEGPLAEHPFPPAPSLRRWLLPAGVAAALALLAGAGWSVRHRVFYGRPATPAPAAATASWRPIFSAPLQHRRGLEPELAPRLLSPLWAPEAELAAADCMQCARFLPDGRLAFILQMGSGSIVTWRPGEKTREVLAGHDLVHVRHLAVLADGSFLWARPEDRQNLHLARATAAGAILPPLAYDLESENPTLLGRLGRALAPKDRGPQGYPWGLAVVSAGQIPAGTGLREGDVLIADEGHRPLVPSIETLPGLWRCRFDEETPATRLGSLFGESFPVDVAVSRHGVFLLNRSERIPSLPGPEDRDRRLFRWDHDGFHPCRLAKPVYDPSALAADPLCGDLYVLQGGLVPSASLSLQRILRLHPTAPDQYEVEVIAERFGKVGLAGLALSADGRRMAVCDPGNRVIVVLRRQ